MTETQVADLAAWTAERRSTDLMLARLHLRVGSLALARTEFEALAGRAGLDGEALVDLAETRWRMGEIGRAGEAAAAALDQGSEAPLALMIAAEAAFALGRPGEARRLATRAMTAAGGTLDALFAGMPRSSVWPLDPADPAPLASTLFGDDRADPAGLVPAPAPDEGTDGAPAGPDAGTDAAATVDAASAGLWDEDDVPPETPAALDPAVLLRSGLAAIGAGDADLAATHLGLAIRIGPHLAPAIIDATRDATQPGLLLVRGDAFRSIGHEAEAASAYAAAARALSDDQAIADGTGTPVAGADAALQSGPTT